MKKLLMPLFLILVVSVGCLEQKQAITQLEVGKSKLLGAGLTIQAVENLKRAEREEDNKVEPRALLLIAYSTGLSSGDARVQGLEAEYKRERTRRLAEMDIAQMKIVLQVLNERHRVQADAAQLLVDKDADAVPLLVESVVKRHYVNLRDGDLFDMLQQIGATALAKIIAAVRAPSTPLSVKIDLVRLIGRIGEQSAVADLESIRNTSAGALKIEINAALYKLGKKEYRQEIVAALKDSDAITRRSAAQALTEVNDSPTADIISILDDADAQVRMYAAQALQNSPDKQAVNPLVSRFKSDADESVKQAVSAALHAHAQKGMAKGLANRLIKGLLANEVAEPKDRVRLVHLLKKPELIKQIKAAPEELNLEYDLFKFEETEPNKTVKDELKRLLLELE